MLQDRRQHVLPVLQKIGIVHKHKVSLDLDGAVFAAVAASIPDPTYSTTIFVSSERTCDPYIGIIGSSLKYLITTVSCEGVTLR